VHSHAQGEYGVSATAHIRWPAWHLLDKSGGDPEAHGAQKVVGYRGSGGAGVH
jgi:hypothetical protein